jgi:hypothetical protein
MRHQLVAWLVRARQQAMTARTVPSAPVTLRRWLFAIVDRTLTDLGTTR